MKDYKVLIDFLLEGEEEDLQAEIKKCLSQGDAPSDILEQGLIKGMQVVGNLYESEEFFIPEMLASAMAMKSGVEILKGELGSGEIQSGGKVLFATVQGDIHDLGKNLCIVVLEGSGFSVIDMGIDVAADAIIAKAKEEKVDIIALSALLSATVSEMNVVANKMADAGLKDSVKLIVGGAPVTEEFAVTIGAAYADDGMACLNKIKELLA